MTHEHEESGFGSFVLGLSLGAGLAAMVTLLKAPKSGEEIRQQLQHALGEVRKEADCVMGVVRTHAYEAKQELSRHFAEIKAESQSALQETRRILAETARTNPDQTQQEVAAWPEGAAHVAPGE